MTAPIWLDAAGRPRPREPAGPVAARSRRCGSVTPTSGLGGAPDLHIPDWCGYTTEYQPVPVAPGWWHPVPIWAPDQAANPLRRYEPAEPR
jgi:hypothetical protein